MTIIDLVITGMMWANIISLCSLPFLYTQNEMQTMKDVTYHGDKAGWAEWHKADIKALKRCFTNRNVRFSFVWFGTLAAYVTFFYNF